MRVLPAVLAISGILAAALWLQGCTMAMQSSSADYLMVTTTASYRPVPVPGMEKRTAQADAEESGRRELLEQVGRMPAWDGVTVSQAMAKNPRLNAEILDAVRTAEVVDWEVWPKNSVRVWMRVDRNRIRQIISSCPR